MTAMTKEQALGRIDTWQKRGFDSGSATTQIGLLLLEGKWLSREDVEAMRIGPANLGHAVKILRAAGYTVKTRPAGRYGRLAFAINMRGRKGSKGTKTVEHEQSGDTHPALGSTLTVRALAFNEHNELVMSLSNGHGSWLVKITGQVTS